MAWKKYRSPELNDFFNSDFFKNYTENFKKNNKNITDDMLNINLEAQLSNDMSDLDLIPFTALEDAYPEERELKELKKFQELYQNM